jgi:hypothetical protein
LTNLYLAPSKTLIMAQPPRPAATSATSTATRTTTATKTTKAVVDDTPMFGKINLTLMLAGAVLIILGMILMAGGRSSNPSVFLYEEVYSTTRITLAPILIIIGILVEVVAIFRQPKVDIAQKGVVS